MIMRCHNTSDRMSDQGFTCKTFQQPYFVFNTALNSTLFGRTPRPSIRPRGTISNEADSDPLIEFAYLYEDQLQTDRSCKRRRVA
jgi:hypothetical protein